MIENEIGEKLERFTIGEADAGQMEHWTIPKLGVRSVDIFQNDERIASVAFTDVGVTVVCDNKDLTIVIGDEV